MNREQMIEKAFYAIWSGCEGSRAQSEMEARAVVDAILPQVTTVEELEALPSLSVLVSAGGTVITRQPWRLDRGNFTVQAAIRLLPLTVVWRPEEREL